jgi:hypothetical protein
VKANIPDFRLTLAGRDLSPSIRPRLVSLTLSEKRGDEADQLEIVLDDSDGRLALPPTDAVLTLQLGWKQGAGVTPGLIDKGSFKVDEVEHKGTPDQVVIRAKSADFTSELKTRREKSWRNTTLGAVIREIAGRNGLQARCAASLASISLPAVVQSRESDMALLRRLGREHDAVATIKRGALIFNPIGTGTSPSGKALASIVIERRDGDQHSYRLARREQTGGVTASWHDRKGAKKKQVTVGKADGARKLARTYATEAQARAAAKSAQGRSDRQPVTFDYTLALGRADLMPELKVSVRGFKAEIDATPWLIGEVAHTVTDRGYVASLKLERA